MAVVIDPGLVLRRPFQQLHSEVSDMDSAVPGVVVVEVRRTRFLADPVEDAAVERFQDLVAVEMPQRSQGPNSLECEAQSVALVPKRVLADRTVHQ